MKIYILMLITLISIGTSNALPPVEGYRAENNNVAIVSYTIANTEYDNNIIVWIVNEGDSDVNISNWAVDASGCITFLGDNDTISGHKTEPVFIYGWDRKPFSSINLINENGKTMYSAPVYVKYEQEEGYIYGMRTGYYGPRKCYEDMWGIGRKPSLIAA